jgi:hypothetical protein
VIVNNLYLVGVAVFPPETNPPLIVYADAVLPVSIAPQQLKPIPRGRGKIADFSRAIELQQSSPRDQFNRLKLARAVSIEQPLGFRGATRLNHNERV